MNIEQFREYCLSKPGTTEELPFGPTTLVFKVMGKMFSLCPVDTFDRISLKCDPDRAVELREKYDAVTAGYHLNKKHWNTILMGGFLPDGELFELIDHSYDLVASSLPKKVKDELKKI